MKKDMQQLNIIHLNKKLEEVSYLNYTEARFSNSAYTIETLEVKFESKELNVFQGDYILIEDTQGNQKFSGIIDYIKDDESGFLTVGAKNLLSILEYRFIEPKNNQDNVVFIGPLNNSIRDIINYCFFENEEEQLNALSINVINSSNNTTNLELKYRYSNLYKVLYALTYNNDIFIATSIDLINRELVFTIEDVIDKTNEITFDNETSSITFEENARSSYNRIIGLGKGNLASRDRVVLQTNEAFGIRTKTYLHDIREDILYETLERRTREKFNELITDYSMKVNYSSDIDGMILGTDFDVGTKVTVYEKKRDITKQDVINKVSYQVNATGVSSSITLELGFYNTLTSIIKKSLQQDAEVLN